MACLSSCLDFPVKTGAGKCKPNEAFFFPTQVAWGQCLITATENKIGQKLVVECCYDRAGSDHLGQIIERAENVGLKKLLSA